MLQGKNLNARKWFRFAKQIEPDKKAPYLGEAITSLKLGDIKACLDLLHNRPGLRNLNVKKRSSFGGESLGESNQDQEGTNTGDPSGEKNAKK